ncbi:CBS domain-containing protein [Candidatus Altiarchaeota archaeon]
MLVSDVMSGDVLTVGPDDSALDIGNLLDEQNVSGAIVTDDGRVLGVISKETFIAHLKIISEEPIESFLAKDFMEANLISLKSDEDLFDAVERIQSLPTHVDRLPVVEDDKLVGVLSKTELTELYPSILAGRFKVRDLMHYNPSTMESYEPLTKVVEEMNLSGVKCVLVMEGTSLVGLITVKDVSLAMFREKKICKRTEPASVLSAADIMSRALVTVPGSMDSAEAAQLMVDKKIGNLPVVDDTLSGMLTRTDLLKGFQLMSQQGESL